MKANNPIVLLTDFGTADGYVGALRGAILTKVKDARIWDISHDIPAHDIRHGAYVLNFTHADFPKGTVFCTVVDPGVGSARRPIVMATKDYLFVGPDNGVMWPAAHSEGEVTVYELPVPPSSSTTFHGRDVFAPAAALLASGQLALEDLTKVSQWERLEFGKPEKRNKDEWQGEIQTIDSFGNVITNFPKQLWAKELKERAFTIRVGRATISIVNQCYDEAQDEELFCIWGSGGYLEISKRQESAAVALGLKRGQPWPCVYLAFS